MLFVSANATERHSDTHEHRNDSDSREFPHIHAPRATYEHPPLHSEGTREDRDSYQTFDDPDDQDDFQQRQRLQQLNDEQEDE
jgi:hypothetical protein